MKPSTLKGFTLVEILIVIVIIIVLVMVVLPRFSEIRANQVLKSAVEETLSAVNKARSQTLASLNSSQYGVHFETDSVTIFTGDTYSAAAADNHVVVIANPASITTISLTGGTSNIIFERLSGEPSASGSVTISNGITSKIITVSATGAVSSN